MSWDKMKETRQEGGKYIRLKDGESIQGVFAGAPRVFYKNFSSKEERDTPATGFSFRFQINFLVKEGEIYVAKIFEQGYTVRSTLLTVRDEYGMDCVYKISRKGSGMEDTEYSILFKQNLTPELIAKLGKVELIPLGDTPPQGYDDERNFENPPADFEDIF